MKTLRVLNNNVVLARDGKGQEVILTGRGIGFNARQGKPVDPSLIVRVFVPADGRDPDHLAEALALVGEEVLRAVVIALGEVGIEGRESTRPTLAIAVADHVAGALDRAKRGVVVEYPLRAEAQALYADEYAQAQRLLAAINERVDPKLDPSEATALTLHLVNAGFASGDLSFTYTMTGVIQQMLAVVQQQYGLDASRESMSAARFITHVRYLFVRIQQHRQLKGHESTIGKGIRRHYPEATRTAQRLATIVEMRLGESLSEDEVSYLALHVARMTTDADVDPETDAEADGAA
ncbi:transcription antiterminator BglG [Streptomyces spiroverticillatus]|uniref:Transcription antiterminator BglG n=1 Tax=Streptomyces finlayi TaxID=67296 RepID=A0A918WW88_9ACTN|nr:PRD domain-containing protein [Streptomyces finlayi]GHA05916.1 transcription antiterminator BglG [Streptomyces spiroverticillatus]GHC89628.1 transcription antiterminator BglG [Streptomyces finlayi]